MGFEVGTIVKGVVTKITAFGAFVALDEEKSGLIHISEVSTDFVRDVSAYLSEGQSVEAVIIAKSSVNKIGLSIKKLLEQRKVSKPPDEYIPTDKTDCGFEDMMSRFKSASDERMSDIKRSFESKRGVSTKRNNRGF